MVDGLQRGLVQRLRRSVIDHAALGQAQHAVAELPRVVHLVQVADHGNAQLARGIAQVLQHAARGLGVQAGHGLVGQDDLGLLGQRAGNAHALHLPARQRLGALQRLVGQAHALQALVGQADIAFAEQLQHRGQGAGLAQAPGQHVLAHRQARHQVVVLEDHGHVASQLAPAVPAAAQHQVHAAHLQRAAVGAGQAVHAAQQRGLAGPRQAQHDDELAGLHIQVDAMQHMVAAIALAQLADADHFMLPRSSLRALAVWRTTS